MFSPLFKGTLFLWNNSVLMTRVACLFSYNNHNSIYQKYKSTIESLSHRSPFDIYRKNLLSWWSHPSCTVIYFIYEINLLLQLRTRLTVPLLLQKFNGEIKRKEIKRSETQLPS